LSVSAISGKATQRRCQDGNSKNEDEFKKYQPVRRGFSYSLEWRRNGFSRLRKVIDLRDGENPSGSFVPLRQ
jgi:hypothetical protein